MVEALLARSMGHPHIVTTFAHGVGVQVSGCDGVAAGVAAAVFAAGPAAAASQPTLRSAPAPSALSCATLPAPAPSALSHATLPAARLCAAGASGGRRRQPPASVDRAGMRRACCAGPAPAQATCMAVPAGLWCSLGFGSCTLGASKQPRVNAALVSVLQPGYWCRSFAIEAACLRRWTAACCSCRAAAGPTCVLCWPQHRRLQVGRRGE